MLPHRPQRAKQRCRPVRGAARILPCPSWPTVVHCRENETPIFHVATGSWSGGGAGGFHPRRTGRGRGLDFPLRWPVVAGLARQRKHQFLHGAGRPDRRRGPALTPVLRGTGRAGRVHELRIRGRGAEPARGQFGHLFSHRLPGKRLARPGVRGPDQQHPAPARQLLRVQADRQSLRGAQPLQIHRAGRRMVQPEHPGDRPARAGASG
jgi:hypothetical protein